MNNKISHFFPLTKKLRNPRLLSFPLFAHHKNLVYLDSAATSLKPGSVIQAISDYYTKYSINSHSEGNNPLSNEVRNTIQQTRQLIADKINGGREEIIFFPSTTY